MSPKKNRFKLSFEIPPVSHNLVFFLFDANNNPSMFASSIYSFFCMRILLFTAQLFTMFALNPTVELTFEKASVLYNT